VRGYDANSDGPLEDEYLEEQHQHQHHHQARSASVEDVRQAHVFPGYSSYPQPPQSLGPSIAPSMSSSMRENPLPIPQPIAVSASTSTVVRTKEEEENHLSLFGDVPEAKRRKFILVDDPGKGGRVRVRVTLDSVDTNEIPDSFRKSNSVYPRSWFPMQMQSPPPSAFGSRFFETDDGDDVEDDRGGARRRRTMVNVSLANGSQAEVATPRMRKSLRRKEVRLNDLGFRMTWHQSRVFADKTVFLQKACEFGLLFDVLTLGLRVGASGASLFSFSLFCFCGLRRCLGSIWGIFGECEGVRNKYVGDVLAGWFHSDDNLAVASKVY